VNRRASGVGHEHGRLTLVATPIGNLGDLSPRAVDALREADVIAAEDTRRARALLSHAGIPAGRRLRSVRAANEAAAAEVLVAKMGDGAHVAYVTDAGMPGISDPGEQLVRACVDAGIHVDAVPGPSALVTALVVSGLPTGRFVFEGFLPRKAAARRRRLDEVAHESRTVVLFESPRRVRKTLAELATACGADRRVAVARELTKAFEEVWRGTLDDALAAVAEEPRGEFVIVVAGTPDSDEVDDRVLADAVERALADGFSVRDAATEVARSLGVPRRRAYEVAITRRRS